MAELGKHKVAYGAPITVVMPVYNRAHLLARVAGTVLAQSYRNFELLIVDDASSDDIEAAVAALDDPRVRLVRRTQNGGSAAARNTGIQEAQHDLIAFHDSDDYCTSDRLELSLRALADLPADYIGIYGILMMYNEVREDTYHKAHVKMIPPATGGPFSGDLAAKTRIANFINIPTVLVKRQALLDAGMFDPLLRKNEDWDLCLRLTQQGSFGFVPEPFVLTPTPLDPKVSSMRVSRSVRQGARSMIRISGKMRHADTRTRPDILARHYANAGRHLMHISRPIFARRFFRASLGLDFGQPKLWVHYAMSFAPGLHARIRKAPKI